MYKLLVVFILSGFVMFAQVPQAINYQGVARDAGGNIITTAIGIKFQIHQGSAIGPVVFDETNTILPSSVGIFTAAIGRGTPGIGTFSSSINWGTASYYLEVSIDPAGGTSYSSVGISELLSVPYALYAKNSGNASVTYSAGNGIAISSGSIINTAMNQTVSIVGGGGTTVSGTYPNYIVSSSTSTSAATSSLAINPPHQITNLGPNNNSITVQPTNITATTGIATIGGTYPNYNVFVPPPILNINGSTITISQGTAVTTQTVGGPWYKPSAAVVGLTSPNDFVGIGITSPASRLHVVEAANGQPAIRAINTMTTVSSPTAMGLWGESSNPHGTSAGVYGTHSGGGNGVTGISSSTTYSSTAGVYGYAAGTASTNVSIQADVSAGNSIGVFANSFAGHNGLAFYALKAGSAGNAGKFEISNTSNSADAIFSVTNGLGSAIHTKNVTSAGSNNLGLLIEDGHIGSLVAVAPTGSVSTACTACSAGAVMPHSTDVAGTITFNMGGNYPSNFDFTVNYAKPYRKIPIVNITPANIVGGNVAKIYVQNLGVVGNYTGFRVFFLGGINGGVGAAQFNYIVLEGSN